LSFSFGLIEDWLLFDPSAQEEKLLSTQISVLINVSSGELNAVKQVGKRISWNIIEKCLLIAKKECQKSSP
jgi:exosome complex RNA-binding protein Rrp42 (RNase PH superfamily)